ncbi:MAG: ribonuclease III [Candidatus Solibacter sp.]
MRAELATLEVKLGHRFTNTELLHRALTHSSLASEIRNGTGVPLCDNEQLEFLGDAVLGMVVSDVLFRRLPASKEGELSTIKARLVCAAHLHGVARRLDLGEYLELGRGEEKSGGRGKKTLLVDALEAIIAAVYLDGGLTPACNFIVEHVMDGQMVFDQEAGTDIQPAVANFKEALRELAKERKLPDARYVVIGEQGPEHSKIFTVEVRLGRSRTAQAEARTKKIAAQRAARALYERLLGDGAPEEPPVEVVPHAEAEADEPA